MITSAPIATFANLRVALQLPMAMQQWDCAERACKPSLLGRARIAFAAMACPLLAGSPLAGLFSASAAITVICADENNPSDS